MPFLQIPTAFNDLTLAVWKVDEEEKYFLDHLNLYENELDRLDSISHPKKRLEWLSSRLCLKELLHIDYKVESLNQTNGKPYLSDFSHNISYTHTAKYSAAIASRMWEVAIDTENLRKKRNLDTAYLFMNSEEMRLFHESGKDRDVFFLIWSAKETLFKIHAQRNISLRKNIHVQLPPNFEIEQEGVVTGIISSHGSVKRYEVYYSFLYTDLLLTYACNRVPEAQSVPQLAC